MKATRTNGFLTVTMLAGLLVAISLIPARQVQAGVSPQAAHHGLVEQQVNRLELPGSAGELVLGDTCSSDAAEHWARSSVAVTAPFVLGGIGTELEVLGATSLPLGQPVAASGCPNRHCQSDATFLGCCSRSRVLGSDRLGACSIRRLCRD